MSSSNIPENGVGYFESSVGIRGDTGPIGPAGPIGPTGPSLLGLTGPSGATLVNIVKLSDNYFEQFYSDGTSKLSTSEIIGPIGYSKIKLTGVSLANFSPLSNSLENQTYDSNFPVDILTFRGLSSNYDPIIRITEISSEGNPVGAETISIDYSAINIGFIGISAGSIGNILENKSGQRQYGITSSNYNEAEEAILIQNKNIQEGLVTVNPILFDSSLACYKVDPDQGSIFYLNSYSQELDSNDEINGFAVLVKKPTLTNHSTGISLHFSPGFTYSGNIYYVTYDNENDISDGITFGDEFYQRFDLTGIEWQNDSYFCPAKEKFNVVNMISLGGRYLAYASQYNSTAANTTDEILDINEDCYPFGEGIDVNDPINFGSGLCCGCQAGTDQLGEITETFSSNCTGYFLYGKTLADSALCSRRGFCCFNNGSSSRGNTTYCECRSLPGSSNFFWHPYTDVKKNNTFFNCSVPVLNSESGCCCDGQGNADFTTRTTCLDTKRYYHGIGTNTVGNVNGQTIQVCTSGEAACCNGGLSCQNSTTYNDCIASGGRFAGDSIQCEQINCAPDNIPCSQSIPNIAEAIQGEEYFGGLILDYFDFNNNNCFGNEIFSNVIANINYYNIADGQDAFGSTNAILYKSKIDYTGYGINAPTSNFCVQFNNFIIIIAKEDVSLNGTNFFRWSKEEVSWGPLIDPITKQLDPLDELTLSYLDEGYIFESQSNKNVASLVLNTFPDCAQVRFTEDYRDWLFNRSLQSINGIWARNYGLYNTARLIGSRYFNNLGPYVPNNSLDGNTVAEAIIKFNIDNPPTSPFESSWFIPSHDEMALIAFLAQNLTDFNINSALAINGFAPVLGEYWTSTGAFDLISGNEGYLDSGTHGSMAWKFNISENSYSRTEKRITQAKVRPIKVIRCDGRYPVSAEDNYKLWRLPLINI